MTPEHFPNSTELRDGIGAAQEALNLNLRGLSDDPAFNPQQIARIRGEAGAEFAGLLVQARGQRKLDVMTDRMKALDAALDAANASGSGLTEAKSAALYVMLNAFCERVAEAQKSAGFTPAVGKDYAEAWQAAENAVRTFGRELAEDPKRLEQDPYAAQHLEMSGLQTKTGEFGQDFFLQTQLPADTMSGLIAAHREAQFGARETIHRLWKESAEAVESARARGDQPAVSDEARLRATAAYMNKLGLDPARFLDHNLPKR